MILLFENEDIKDSDVIAIQELLKNQRDQTVLYLLKFFFDLIDKTDKNRRVCFYVNKHISISS